MPAHKLFLVHGTESESKYVEIFKQLLPCTDEAGEEKQILFLIASIREDSGLSVTKTAFLLQYSQKVL